jgi:hypothetical protein
MEALDDDIGFLSENLPPEHRHFVEHVCFYYDGLLSTRTKWLDFFETLNKTNLELQWKIYCEQKPIFDITDVNTERALSAVQVLTKADDPFRKVILDFFSKAYKVLRLVQNIHFAELELFVSKKLNNN